MTRTLPILLLLIALLLRGQQAVNIVEEVPPASVTYKYAYDASNRIEYIGQAKGIQPLSTWAISCGGTPKCATLTSIVDAANTSTVTTVAAHGLTVGNKVTISGETGDTDLNGTYSIQTIGSTTTFTITTANVTDATYSASAVKITSTAPLTTDAIWGIQKNLYNASGLQTEKQWSTKCSSNDETSTTNTSYAHIWDNRATSTGSTKICYQ